MSASSATVACCIVGNCALTQAGSSAKQEDAFTSHTEHGTMSLSSNRMSSLLAAAARRRFLAACVVAAPFLASSATYGQVEQVPGARSAVSSLPQQNPAPVDPGTLSCNALKAKIGATGELAILSGPKGAWGDTFYGPAVPRCEFWQMPVFTYVRANDGLCGVGYICVDKLSID